MFMNESLKYLAVKLSVTYLDDILFYSYTKKDHLRDLESGINVLKRNQLVSKARKCQLMAHELVFLGH